VQPVIVLEVVILLHIVVQTWFQVFLNVSMPKQHDFSRKMMVLSKYMLCFGSKEQVSFRL